jgi:hypothetical protein
MELGQESSGEGGMSAMRRGKRFSSPTHEKEIWNVTVSLFCKRSDNGYFLIGGHGYEEKIG